MIGSEVVAMYNVDHGIYMGKIVYIFVGSDIGQSYDRPQYNPESESDKKFTCTY